ncbi:hypothetical protein [Botrimarina hoheduenensis]|uniref:Zinc-finger domain-containing protein n=1 Tax=Botrimarina hoheduenensis TaxID=2528000 RepID=A0A5C5WDN0_9BACT|nr:hypothetical protein [Botrimarina hoheduenensis]TWT47792.1 hypothetical protein Pla111_14150 [Botrimarina hoheduenensis]
MDCDQAFAALTRGPLTGHAVEDASVLEHLVGCESCLRLAEALRPAPELFHEALRKPSAEPLPAFAPREEAVAALLRGANGGTGRLSAGPLRLYRRAAPPARRTWTAGRRIQATAPPAHTHEVPTLFERIAAVMILAASATLSMGALAWGVALALRWWNL